ncbi:hypothetical protein PFICI_03871 [Pestalotiopsis fici W106-1]|uniref:Carboxypeptidase n=1 Tax=Pestalotiopsis fici (strain W106-1 / CGMCC3.15140) TaxID=1229662 RepID=W3XKU0_PESFW|nr:uncharacterized protein PFICI_03871 [Pestalotiopsis fici W106-1]ETS85846.1 hypothetical protein PFICI_03871 [Pestalotiopsis fici W106-1]
MLLFPTALLASQTILQGGRTDALPQPADNGVGIPHRQLDDSVCPAQTKHFTGSIGLGHGKELFYWLFSSASDPEHDPLLVWLTGCALFTFLYSENPMLTDSEPERGPGGASTLAAVTEVGPCWVNTTDNSTYHNPYHWAKHANLLILETLEAATEDFVDFLHHFVTKEFPELSKNVLHIAGESYGGRWAPAFMHKLAGLSDVQSARAIPNPLGSIILVNAVIGTLGADLATSNYEFGCTPDGVATKLGVGFNSTVCSKIQEVGPQCEAYGALCESTDSIAICKDASAFCAGGTMVR